MFEQIDLTTAQARQWDVVIAGSSFAAMFFLRGLPKDLSVLIVERGNFIPQEEQVNGRAVPQEDYAMANTSGHEKNFRANRVFGGNSNCWWGQVPRFHPSDFRLFENHGLGASWPIGYDDLEPFWAEVESVMEVAGGGNEGHLPRSSAFPFPPHRMNRHDIVAAEKTPDIWFPAPTARANGGSRATCCATGRCDLCPVDAKFTVENGLDHFDRPGVSILMGVEVHAVVVEAGQATGLSLRGPDGEAEVSGKHVALATNAINNSAIMLRSGLTARSLGRYLTEQLGWYALVDVDADGYFGGTSITGHCYAFIDPDNRDEAASVLIESYNAPPALRVEPGKWTHRMRLKLVAEDLPLAENRVVLDGDKPKIEWTGHDSYARKGLRQTFDRLPEIIPFDVEAIHFGNEEASEAHILGTHRMGSDPLTSVVKDTLETHEVSGLYALGSGVFPTCSAANPTLTLSALSLRAGRLLA